jgi:hypothetical protein
MFQGEHVEIGGVPVQFLTDDPVLLREAIEAAVEIPYDETLQPPAMTRLVTPTYLAALWLLPSANTPVRRERTARLREAGLIDDDLRESATRSVDTRMACLAGDPLTKLKPSQISKIPLPIETLRTPAL